MENNGIEHDPTLFLAKTQGAIAKWLRRQIRNLFLFEGAGSNPAGVAIRRGTAFSFNFGDYRSPVNHLTVQVPMGTSVVWPNSKLVHVQTLF